MDRIYKIDALPQKMVIGRQTETGVEVVQFDCAEWISHWPQMEISVWATRPGETAAYPVVITRDGNIVTRTVSAVDTAIDGEGSVEIMGVADDKRKLSARVIMRVYASGLGNTQNTPASAKPWVDEVLDAAKRAEDAANVTAHPPVIGDKGNWLVWSVDENEYIDSGVRAEGRDAEPYTLPTASETVKGGVKVGEGLQMDGDVLGVKPEPEYELIETIVCDGTYGVFVRYNLALSHAKIHIHTQAAEEVNSIGVEAHNAAGMFGYAWIGNGVATNERWSYVYLVSDGKNAYCEYRGPVTAYYGTASVGKTVAVQDASTPINRFNVYVSGGGLFPEGTTVEIWGVRADA